MHYLFLLALWIWTAGALGNDMPPEHCPESYLSDLEAERSWYDMQAEIFTEQAVSLMTYLNIMEDAPGLSKSIDSRKLIRVAKLETRTAALARKRTDGYWGR